MGDGKLGEFTLGVGTNIETLAVFSTIKQAGTDLKLKATEFIAAEAACVGGSSTDTAHKKAVRVALLALTDTAADAVEQVAQGNVEILTASGFHLTSPGGVSPAPVGTVAIQSITNIATTKLGLNLAITGNVMAVIVERQNADGTWLKIAMFTDLNDIVVTGLVPGSSNTFRVCAMAAGNQTSEYSVPMTAICT
jgi:hypothetical protein